MTREGCGQRTLTEAEAAEELARVSVAATPEWLKGQARERVKQRAARRRVRKRRVALQGLVSAEGEALVDARAQGRDISQHRDGIFAAGGEASATQEEREEFLQLVSDLSGASEWTVTLVDMQAAARSTSDTAPGHDELPYAHAHGRVGTS